MVQFNHAQRELTLKVVYYGPALSGKTTNLQMVHQLLDPQARGRLMTLDTADDRTLFFDLLPVFFQTRSGFKVKIKLYTVPGQVMHVATRRIVLAGADAVAFIADSQKQEARANTESWDSLQENLKLNGIETDQLATCIQFNKRDLPNVRSDAEIEALQAATKDPIIKAVAVRGEGVLETLYVLLRLTYRKLESRHGLGEKLGITEAEFLRSIFRRMNPHGGHSAGLMPGIQEVSDSGRSSPGTAPPSSRGGAKDG